MGDLADLDDWGHGWSDPDWDHEEQDRLRALREEREAQERADREENERRRWPANCGYCGSAFENTVTYGDDPECVGMPYIYKQARYECGTEVGGRNGSSFEERVEGGQTNACRTIMELRWKTDPEALERDRTDHRTEREQMTVEAEREWLKAERERAKQARRHEILSRLTTTDTWTDAEGVTKPIVDLDHGHLINIRLWLDANAGVFHRLASRAYWAERDVEVEDVRGEAVNVGIPPEVHRRMEQDLAREPLEWMRDQPVYQAVLDAIKAGAPLDRREAGFVSVVSPTPPPVPEAH